MIDAGTRRYAAALGRRHFDGTMTLEALFEHFGASDDPLIRALLEAAAHQPRRGFGGISKAQWERDFWQPVSALLVELEKGLDGRAPTTRVYPRGGSAAILGWSAFTLFAGASAAEHAIELWKLLRGGTTLGLWEGVLESVGLVVMGIASWAGVRMTLLRLHLFRTQSNPYGNYKGSAS